MNWYRILLASFDPTELPEFKNWFGPSKTVDEEGKPLVLYHGTTHAFDEFNRRKGETESHFGRGHYFTNSQDDVGFNYAREGPDLTSRIEQLAEQIMQRKNWDQFRWNSPEYKNARAKAIELARQKLSGNTPNVIPAYLRMHNPVIIQPEGGTTFEIEYVEDEEGNILQERGSGIKLLKAIKRIAQKYNLPKLPEEFGEKAPSLTNGMTSYQVDKALRECESLQYCQDNLGRLNGSHIIGEIFRACGFDGIIMDAYHEFGLGRNMGKPMEGIEPDTRHYIVWNPTQIKSSLGNSTFNPKSRKLSQ